MKEVKLGELESGDIFIRNKRASQLFEADTKEEANNKIEEFKKNFQDKARLEENIEP